MVGVGFLTLPILVSQVGIWLFASISILVTLSVYYGVSMLVAVSDDIGYNGGSYERIISKVFKSETLDNLVKLAVILLQLANCIANIIFVGLTSA